MRVLLDPRFDGHPKRVELLRFLLVIGFFAGVDPNRVALIDFLRVIQDVIELALPMDPEIPNAPDAPWQAEMLQENLNGQAG